MTSTPSFSLVLPIPLLNSPSISHPLYVALASSLVPGHPPSRVPPVPGSPVLLQATYLCTKPARKTQRKAAQEWSGSTPWSSQHEEWNSELDYTWTYSWKVPTAGILLRELRQLFPIIWMCFLGTSSSPGSCPSFTRVNPPATTECKWPYKASLGDLVYLSICAVAGM